MIPVCSIWRLRMSTCVPPTECSVLLGIGLGLMAGFDAHTWGDISTTSVACFGTEARWRHYGLQQCEHATIGNEPPGPLASRMREGRGLEDPMQFRRCSSHSAGRALRAHLSIPLPHHVVSWGHPPNCPTKTLPLSFAEKGQHTGHVHFA